MRKALLLAAMLALTGCSTSPTPARPHFATFDDVLTSVSKAVVDSRYPSSDRAQLGQCLAQSVNKDIPDNDKVLLLNLLNGGQVTPAADDAMYKWFGLHWSEQGMAADFSPAFKTRVRANFRDLCPEMMGKHPDFLA